MMNYEEKRELRLQISQLLADAGLNQGTIKEIVEQEIRNKVDRAIEQVLKKLDSQCSSGDYVGDRIKWMLQNTYLNQRAFDRAVEEELKNKVVKVVLTDCKLSKEDDENAG